jgi:hypothetical protein
MNRQLTITANQAAWLQSTLTTEARDLRAKIARQEQEPPTDNPKRQAEDKQYLDALLWLLQTVEGLAARLADSRPVEDPR